MTEKESPNKDNHDEDDEMEVYTGLVFRGLTRDAVYQDGDEDIHENNPLSRALPRIFDTDEFLRRATYFPEYSGKERNLKPKKRVYLTVKATEFFQPLSMHIELENKISTVLRAGYRGRNPLNYEYFKALDEQTEQVIKSTDDDDVYGTNDPDYKKYIHQTRSSNLTFVSIGTSGMGKTLTFKIILGMYPQVLLHKKYAGKKFSFRQIVWLIVECPHNGSVRQLCVNFLQAVDNILKTTYERDHNRNDKSNEPTLLKAMARVSALHGIGVLVIDEINNLSVAKSGGEEKMLNFFVSLTNVMGIPIIPVGTPKAANLFNKALRMARRASGQGDVIWTPLLYKPKENPEENVDIVNENDSEEENAELGDEDFVLFLESLWRYQFTKKETKLTKKLIVAMYFVSQGILDFAVKIYIMAQIRAITTGAEKVTERIIRSVGVDSFQLSQPMRNALSSGDIKQIERFDDIKKIDLYFYTELALKILDGQRQLELPTDDN